MEIVSTYEKRNVLKRIDGARRKMFSFAEIFYFIFFFILIGIKSTYIELTADVGYFFLASAVFLALKYLFTDWKIKEVFICLILLTCGAISYLQSGHSVILVTLAAIAGFKGIDKRRFVKVVFTYRAVLYIALVAFYNMDMVPGSNDLTFGDYTFVDGDAVRVLLNHCSLGFTGSNPAHIMFFVAVVGYLFVFHEKYNLIHAAAIVLANFLLYDYTNCRTAFILVNVVAAIAYVLRWKRLYRFTGKFAVWLVPFVTLFCLLMTFGCGRNSFFNEVNVSFSERFNLSQSFMNEIPISLFGRDTSSVSDVFDVAYLNLFLNYGIFFTVLFLLGQAWLFADSVREDMPGYTLALVAFLLLGITENYMLDAGVNFTLALLGGLLFPDKKPFGLGEGVRL